MSTPDARARLIAVIARMKARAQEHRAYSGVPCQCESRWHADEIDEWVTELEADLLGRAVSPSEADLKCQRCGGSTGMLTWSCICASGRAVSPPQCSCIGHGADCDWTAGSMAACPIHGSVSPPPEKK